MGAAAAPCHRLHHRQRPARAAGGRHPGRGVRPWVHPVMSPNRVGGRAHEIHDAEAEMHGVRGADAPDGLRGEPAQGYGVHVRVREMWTHDEEDAEASFDSPPAETKMISRWGADAIREREKIRRAGWMN